MALGQQQQQRFMELSIAQIDTVFVPTDVLGDEAVGVPGHWSIHAAVVTADLPTTERAAGILDQLVGATATLTMAFGGAEDKARHVHGVITAAEWLGTDAQSATNTNRDRFHRYRLEVQPKAFLLDLTRRSRVYQQLSAVDIARKLLDEHKLAAELAVDTATLKAQDQPVLAYTVQYEETDLAFLTRILAESGLWWTLIHQAESTGLVIGADPHGFADLQAGGDKRLVNWAPSASAKALPDGKRVEAVLQASPCRRMATGAVRVRRYDPGDPTAPQQAEALAEGMPEKAPSGETYLPGHVLPDAAVLARTQLARQLGDVRTWTGRSDVRALQPGRVVTLVPAADDQGPAAPGAPQTAVALLSVSHEAHQRAESASEAIGGASYVNTFTGVPPESGWRMPLPPRPQIPGFITAHIDGASSDEMTPAPLDDQGRYRVKLHLDREKTDPGKGSLPVRMAQPYAGPPTARNDRSGLHAPLHVKTEVVLAHLDGDPDRPIIAGAVPHALTRSPSDQDNAPHTVLRSVGANEVVLDDTKGAERLRLVAERDHQVIIRHDETHRVGNQLKLYVGKDVDGAFDAKAESAAGEFHPDAKPPGTFGKLEYVFPASLLAVGGFYQIGVAGDMNTTVIGARTNQTLGFQHDYIKGVSKTQIDGKSEVIVKETHQFKAKAIMIEAEDELTIVVGKAKITMKKDGDIQIEGKNLIQKASGNITGKASGDVILKGSKTGAN
jgi:type VI secretion system VgrG family protein